jgi:hypothetical protein
MIVAVSAHTMRRIMLLISANGPCPLPLHPPPSKSAVSQDVIAGLVRLPPSREHERCSGASHAPIRLRMPQLKRVVLALGNRLIYRDTFEEALAELTGGPASAAPALAAVTSVPAPAAAGQGLPALAERLRSLRDQAEQLARELQTLRGRKRFESDLTRLVLPWRSSITWATPMRKRSSLTSSHCQRRYTRPARQFRQVSSARSPNLSRKIRGPYL